jgi:hypothetical protein
MAGSLAGWSRVQPSRPARLPPHGRAVRAGVPRGRGVGFVGTRFELDGVLDDSTPWAVWDRRVRVAWEGIEA